MTSTSKLSATASSSSKSNTPNIPNSNSNSNYIDLVSPSHHQQLSCPHAIQQIYKQSHDGPFPSKLASTLAREKIPKMKIKLEPGYRPTATNTQQNTQSHAASATTHDDTTPRDTMEHAKVSLLQQMGFTDVNEMLVGLRHVERLPENAMNYDPEAHVQLAMLWIVSQREEADEARRMDVVRMASEVILIDDDVDKNDPYYITNTASRDDILGPNPNYGVMKPSKLFPSSIILQSSRVKALFHSILLYDATTNYHKQQNDKSSSAIVRLLILEKKARKWFGSKIPYAFFHHILRGTIESWTTDGVLTPYRFSQLIDLLLNEVRQLENELYSLSQQETGDLGMMVPKSFLRAREKYADARERAIFSTGSGSDDIVIIDDDD